MGAPTGLWGKRSSRSSVAEARFAEALSFYASPSSTIGFFIAVVLLMRPRRPSFYSKGLGKKLHLQARSLPAIRCLVLRAARSIASRSTLRKRGIAAPTGPFFEAPQTRGASE